MLNRPMGWRMYGHDPYGYPPEDNVYANPRHWHGLHNQSLTQSTIYDADLSDEEVMENVEDNLEDDPYLLPSELKRLEIAVDGGIVTLSGRVKSRESKWHAYSDAYWSDGVVDVVNKIEIKNYQNR